MDQKESPTKNLYELQSEFLSDPVKAAYGHQGSGVDYHLQRLINMVNESGTELSFGVTLFGAFGTVSGTLISRKKYFEKFGKSFQDGFERAFPDQDWSYVGQSYNSMAVEGDDLVEDGAYRSPPQFIHLEDAKLLGANGAFTISTPMLWRAKVQAVDAFILGNIS